jgi:hypothetical protein
MPLDSTQIDVLVASPSLGTITYQAISLLRQLDRINSLEYLPEACNIKEMFECLAEHVLSELWAMRSPDQMFDAVGDADFSRTRALGRVLHQLHAFVRYLWASSPRQSPPGIQGAVNLLAELHFPTTNGTPVCLVRPQWKYNLTYVSMTAILKDKILSLSDLDPNDSLGPDADSKLLELWKRHCAKITDEERRSKLGLEPPQQVAILSFAGLDTHDTLLYPLLAHELGHFIDFSFPAPLNVSASIASAAQIREEEVRQVLEQYLGSGVQARVVTANHKSIVDRVFVAVREILADLLAARIMGLGYFAAHSEFLKTLADWPQATLTSSGYPGIKYRLRLVLEHLLDVEGCNYRNFLRPFIAGAEPASREIAIGIHHFLSSWESRLAPDPNDFVPSGNAVIDALNDLAQKAVARAHPEIVKLVKQTITPERCCRIGPNFFQRIQLLREYLPPSCPGESAESFAEIMASAWAYQILFGEEQEQAKQTIGERTEEYMRICQLTLKAIELIPTRGGDEIPPPAESGQNSSILQRSGSLSCMDLLARLQLPLGNRQRFSVIPFNRKAVQAASLDVHLGNLFVNARRTRLRSVRLGDKAGERVLMSVGREESYVWGLG